MQGSVLVAGLVGLLILTATARAETAWTLWERPVDLRTGEPRGEWQARQSFEAERWCRGEMTQAINRSIAASTTPTKAKGREPVPTIGEFQCLREGDDPRRVKGK